MNVGEIYMYAGSTAPTGFIICDGSAISRATYSELFDVIGTTYGTGDGSTTFNLPDLSGRVVIGVSSNYSIGNIGGEEAHSLTVNEMPSHTHKIAPHTHENTITVTTPKLSHSITQPTFTYAAPSGNSKTIGSGGYKTTTSTNATRSANVAISNHTASACTKSGGVLDCAAFDTGSAGSGQAHDNMQPFVTINYIIYSGVGA
jgi:microcystin-dependent protein